MKYFTDSNRPPVKAQNSGKEKEPIYKERLDKKTGETVLKIVGYTNVLQRAQADKDACDISKLMERYGVTEVDSVRKLHQQFVVEYDDVESLGDLSGIDVLNKMSEIKEAYMSSDGAVKRYYGDDFNRFAAAVQNKTIYDDLRKIAPGAIKEPAQPVQPQPVQLQPVQPQPVQPQPVDSQEVINNG